MPGAGAGGIRLSEGAGAVAAWLFRRGETAAGHWRSAGRPVRGFLLLELSPLPGLDPVGRQEFLALTDRLCGEGVTVLLVSHNADALADHARRIVTWKMAFWQRMGRWNRSFHAGRNWRGGV